ncbi:MAG: right-handed parallel beta-helix repeat-containing protein [Myxococcales bacterium]|nr:right-handed parallel beta-helix repeat-containing protein [Myxococcales bacterium]
MFLTIWATAAMAEDQPTLREVCEACDYTTVRAAVSDADDGDTIVVSDEAVTDDDTVSVDASVTIRSASGKAHWTMHGNPGLEIDASGVTVTGFVLVPDNSKRAVRASDVTDLLLENLTMEDHYFNAVGGGFLLEDETEAEVRSCTFVNNHANGEAAAIYVVRQAQVTVSDSHFETQTATGPGGAIRVGDGAELIVQRSTFLSNESNVEGGAISVWGTTSRLLVHDCIFHHNTSSDGAAIYTGGALELTGSGNHLCANTAVDGASVRSGATTLTWWNNVHRDTTGAALHLHGVASDVHDNDVLGSDEGIAALGSSASIRNNLLAHIGGTALDTPAPATVQVDHNGWWSNGLDRSSGHVGPNAVTGDPRVPFVADGLCDGDLRRHPDSPLLGAGDPELADQDIGALGKAPSEGTEGGNTGTMPTDEPTDAPAPPRGAPDVPPLASGCRCASSGTAGGAWTAGWVLAIALWRRRLHGAS